ncbi:hypothetical protein JL475_33675 [Streptomyces sp. M2CJ-2]|uniref:hypothetical protein n=1 Tax=Streptomyces sp. M2CJ-2 TaxID=2803948 RepID=UPI001925F40D|nr:hypothetical protein [Streptomyces sp. M2CJ-2]MBL3670824.1 hypothetical protein [Streptomyces sp. M2CJ-2]
MRWPDEIRNPPGLAPPVAKLPKEEIDQAITLINSMARDEFRGTYTETPEQIIEAKRNHKVPSKVTVPEAEPGQVLDLMPR